MFKKGEFKGHVFKKGNQTINIKKKVERFKLGLEIECKKHGSHKKWRLHSANNVQCLFCASVWQMNQRRRNPLRFIYRDAKKHALTGNREFSITLEDLININEKQQNKCALTGEVFDFDNPPSLDRIDSGLGYRTDNIQLILIHVNRMKSDLSQDDFIRLCCKIVSYSRKK